MWCGPPDGADEKRAVHAGTGLAWQRRAAPPLADPAGTVVLCHGDPQAAAAARACARDLRRMPQALTRGAYPFALVVLSGHELWLARDRCGLEPLYFALDPPQAGSHLALMRGDAVQRCPRGAWMRCTLDPASGSLTDARCYSFASDPRAWLPGPSAGDLPALLGRLLRARLGPPAPRTVGVLVECDWASRLLVQVLAGLDGVRVVTAAAVLGLDDLVARWGSMDHHVVAAADPADAAARTRWITLGGTDHSATVSRMAWLAQVATKVTGVDLWVLPDGAAVAAERTPEQRALASRVARRPITMDMWKTACLHAAPLAHVAAELGVTVWAPYLWSGWCRALWTAPDVPAADAAVWLPAVSNPPLAPSACIRADAQAFQRRFPGLQHVCRTRSEWALRAFWTEL